MKPVVLLYSVCSMLSSLHYLLQIKQLIPVITHPVTWASVFFFYPWQEQKDILWDGIICILDVYMRHLKNIKTAASRVGFEKRRFFSRLLTEIGMVVRRTKAEMIWDTGRYEKSTPLLHPQLITLLWLCLGSCCWLLNLNSLSFAIWFSVWNFFFLAVCQFFSLANRLQGMVQINLFCLALDGFPFIFCFHCFILNKAYLLVVSIGNGSTSKQLSLG